MEVVKLEWPADESERERLAGERVPRLLLVAPDAPPPIATDALEDWVRLPATEADIQARVLGLAGRVDPRPALDDDGVLRCNGAWVSLPPVEARLIGALVDRFGAVVSRDVLSRVGWPTDGAPGRNALDVHVLRIRRRIDPLGLAIRTVRSRGYLLEHAYDRALPRPSDTGQESVRFP